MQTNVHLMLNGEFDLDIDFANKKITVSSKTEKVIFYNI
jgi:hypothetical protein